jgi:hypothetical protein
MVRDAISRGAEEMVTQKVSPVTEHDQIRFALAGHMHEVMAGERDPEDECREHRM